ncbi:MAG: pyruvate kinase [Clostridiales bacterium]|jgi:pyruvate kinase|nr:pyruvate kinase [Clostridiales bacterium]
MRKTKIVCTLGPATDDYAVIKQLVKAGMNVARLNMSHGTHAEHKKRIEMIKRVREETDSPVAVLLDTKGPEIRVKRFRDGAVTLADGQTFTLTANEVEGDAAAVSLTFKELPGYVKPGQQILLNDGLIELRALSVGKTDIVCRVQNGGELSDLKKVNLPDCRIDMPYVSAADREDILFAIGEDADYLAISFVRSGDDVRLVRNILNQNGGDDIQIISKIENREGVDRIEEILALSDGIMVARGDMGVEIPFEELPAIQKDLIKRSYRAGKKVITATQMLESMLYNPRPTRAEASDVANAVYDGTSAVMLSGETAAGRFPVEAVRAMDKIVKSAENSINYQGRFDKNDAVIVTVPDAVSHSTVAAAFDLSAKAIICVSHSGYTARKVSRFRPGCVIIAATVNQKVFYQLALNWGVVPVRSVIQKTTDALFEHAIHCAKSTGLIKSGDLVVITSGSAVGRSGNSNIMRIEIVN